MTIVVTARIIVYGAENADEAIEAVDAMLKDCVDMQASDVAVIPAEQREYLPIGSN
jgi:hypothetical protein